MSTESIIHQIDLIIKALCKKADLKQIEFVLRVGLPQAYTARI